MDWTRVYEDIVDFARSTPGWLHTLAEVGTDAGLFVFAALFVLVAVRAWRAPARDLALAVAGPAGIVLAYILSEVIKTFVQEDRPCRGGIATIAACPPLDDWSFPSNHSVIAAGAAATLVLAWRSLAWAVFPLAVVMAFSRVFVGVHYPHDVAAGFLLGATLAPLFALLLVGAITPAVRLLRARLPEHLGPTAPDPAPNWRQRPTTSDGRHPSDPQPPFEDPQQPFANPHPSSRNPQPSSGGPQPSFENAQRSFGDPQPSYGGPQPSFGNAQRSFGDPQPSYGSAQSSYGDLRPSFDADPHQPFRGESGRAFEGDPRQTLGADPSQSFGTAPRRTAAVDPRHGYAADRGAQPSYGEATAQHRAAQPPRQYTEEPPWGHAEGRSRHRTEGPPQR
ncbi:phosphatase PAP2 family protein [Nonomuraea fuscirosea]|uniref:phosphatase PAP2 family protein n=1 Tax=Nonomuraea fuscirosea TaxID=1291556 RepID=UPI0034147DF1